MRTFLIIKYENRWYIWYNEKAAWWKWHYSTKKTATSVIKKLKVGNEICDSQLYKNILHTFMADYKI